MAEITMTKKELASIAGYTYRRLYDIDKALPNEAKLFVKSEDGKYDLALFVQRWVRYNVDNETEGDMDLDTVKARHELVKTKKTEIEVARLEGRLVDVTEVQQLWAHIAHTLMQNFTRLPSSIAPQLVQQKKSTTIAAILERAICETLNQIADTPLPEGAVGSGTEASEEEDEV